jgi:hypothetical protein
MRLPALAVLSPSLPMIDRPNRLALVVPAYMLFVATAVALATALVAGPARSDTKLWRDVIAQAERGERQLSTRQAAAQLKSAVDVIEAQRDYHELLREGVGAFGLLLAAAGLVQLRDARAVIRRAGADGAGSSGVAHGGARHGEAMAGECSCAARSSAA